MREGFVKRETKETSIEASLNWTGRGYTKSVRGSVFSITC
jgi:imidazoleglycerol phosphate dehydratase HisB